ncbi:hypothetical protein QAD02_012293 [Eretmocerus hayati]|uniref:Uncharacterized protein n=1 Tax=Eretmocerus hayati TaxID=131215 RepID=A0ACC2NZB0_9HYME|nr:hypothetical protein QAD02_012293 [Eretmocerus hayati]
MDIPRNPKEKFLADLKALIDQSNNVIKNTCDYLGWDLDKIQEKHDRYIFCPFDEGHWMPKESLEKHLQTCEWKALGYTKECVPLTESFLPPNNPSTLKFDTELQQKVLGEAREKCPNSKISVTERFIPQTSDRLFSDFTTDERRAMYDYVVANTVAPDIGEDIADINKPSDTSEDKQSKTMLELLAQERNLKRRRAKYKGVHTNKKSHTEILREIIEQQLEMFKEHLAEKFGTSFPNDDGAAENKSTASSEKRLFKDRESSRNNPTHGRFYDENPSPRLSQVDRKDGHSNSHKDRYSRSADGHRSRDRDRHCHRSDEDYNNFHEADSLRQGDPIYSK